jgi:cytochrome c
MIFSVMAPQQPERAGAVKMGAAAVICASVLACAQGALAELRGHGGPVRAFAIASDGKTAISGSFDGSAILWSLDRDRALQVLRFHDGAVDAVAMLPDGRAATAGEDGGIALWTLAHEHPDAVLRGHAAPVVALAVSRDGSKLASAGWDGTVRVWPLSGGAPLVLEGHQQNVNAVAFMPDRSIVSGSYDGSLRLWPANGSPIVRTLESSVNTLAVASDGEIIAGTADGQLHFFSTDGTERSRIEVQPTPVTAIAISPDGNLIAVAGMRGLVKLVQRGTRALDRALVGQPLPVWAVAFSADGRVVFTAGADRAIRRWDAETGEPIGPPSLGRSPDVPVEFAADPGAHIFRACAACHSLQPDRENRAGPTLYGILGRRIASVPGYPYSEAFRHFDIVWTRETVAKLFEVGPARFTPGTKMPEQRIRSAEDREALVDFLERATKTK